MSETRPSDAPDPRLVEDLIARGQRSLAARESDEPTRVAIERAATWLYQQARTLRHAW
jgi:hypothetical protein